MGSSSNQQHSTLTIGWLISIKRWSRLTFLNSSVQIVPIMLLMTRTPPKIATTMMFSLLCPYFLKLKSNFSQQTLLRLLPSSNIYTNHRTLSCTLIQVCLWPASATVRRQIVMLLLLSWRWISSFGLCQETTKYYICRQLLMIRVTSSEKLKRQ